MVLHIKAILKSIQRISLHFMQKNIEQERVKYLQPHIISFFISLSFKYMQRYEVKKNTKISNHRF